MQEVQAFSPPQLPCMLLFQVTASLRRLVPPPKGKSPPLWCIPPAGSSPSSILEHLSLSKPSINGITELQSQSKQGKILVSFDIGLGILWNRPSMKQPGPCSGRGPQKAPRICGRGRCGVALRLDLSSQQEFGSSRGRAARSCSRRIMSVSVFLLPGSPSARTADQRSLITVTTYKMGRGRRWQTAPRNLPFIPKLEHTCKENRRVQNHMRTL